MKLLKFVIIEKYKEGLLDNPEDLSDIKGNYCQHLAKCLLLKNDKGMTPLSLAIEVGANQLFSVLLAIYTNIEDKNPNSKVLSEALVTKDRIGM